MVTGTLSSIDSELNNLNTLFNTQRVIVTHPKGTIFQNCGSLSTEIINSKRNLSLSSIESLFLTERRALQITVNNTPISLQETYTKLATQDTFIMHYLVYSHLKRLGYSIRHVIRDKYPPIAKATSAKLTEPRSFHRESLFSFKNNKWYLTKSSSIYQLKK